LRLYKIRHYSQKVGRELMDTTAAGLREKGTMSTVETSLRIICPPCVTAMTNAKTHFELHCLNTLSILLEGGGIHAKSESCTTSVLFLI
jgi:hypothetical protein